MGLVSCGHALYRHTQSIIARSATRGSSPSSRAPESGERSDAVDAIQTPTEQR
jgi:hypothetical protein